MKIDVERDTVCRKSVTVSTNIEETSWTIAWRNFTDSSLIVEDLTTRT